MSDARVGTDGEPLFALRGITVRGRDYHAGDPIPHPPSLSERGLATADPVKAAALREVAALQRERRAARQRVYELDARLADVRAASDRETAS